MAVLARGARLVIGCGARKHDQAAIGIDALNLPGVDIVGDVAEVMRLVEDQSVRGIYAAHFKEHVDNVSGLMAQIARVLEVGGELEIIAPQFSNAYSNSDLSRKTARGLYTLSYFLASR